RLLHLLAGHAAAGVEGDAEAHRDALGIEVRDLHWLAVLVDGEVLRAQAWDEAAVHVGDGGGDGPQLDAAPESELVVAPRPLWRLGGLAVQRHSEKGRRSGRKRDASNGGTHGHPFSAPLSRRSTCGTTRSSVLKLTRYRLTSLLAETMTSKV